jgi:hypothetical protein
MSVQNAYNDWSASYDTDENLTRDFDRKVLREALENLHFPSILEIGEQVHAFNLLPFREMIVRSGVYEKL